MIYIVIIEAIIIVFLAFKDRILKKPEKVDEEVIKREKAMKKAFNELMNYDEKKARGTKW